MVYFREIINGPPCRMKRERSVFFQPIKDDDNSGINSEAGLIDWMCKFSDAQKNSRSTKVITQHWIQYFQDIGITVFSYQHIGAHKGQGDKHSSVIAYHGLSESWKKSYMMQGFCENDPLMSYAFNENKLFKLSDLPNFIGGAFHEENYLQLLNQLSLSEGYAFPVFGSAMCDGFYILGLARGHANLNKQQLSMVQWACQIGHDNYVALMMKEKDQADKSIAKTILSQQKAAQVSDKQAADKVITDLKKANITDKAETKNQSYLFQVAAAMSFGYGEPFSRPQSELNYTLLKMTASQQVTQDAWKLYHMLRQMKDNEA